MTKRRALLVGIAMALVVAALVATWSFMVFAPAQETLDQRVYDVASQLKCPVCQGESVANSPALISQQMRALIRQQLQAGMSEQQVIQYFRSRYGDRILWSPPQQGFTLLAWVVPPGGLILGAVIVFLVLRGWGKAKKRAEVEGKAEVEDEEELASFEARLERELAAEDALFSRQGKEVN